MDSPFNSGRWGNLPRRPRYPQNFRAQTTPSPSHKPKVVSIPVQFVQSENCSKPVHEDNSRSDYAIRIQKMWRGFRVRKSVKKIREIQRELGEAERTILDSQTVEALRRDERERLKVNERLMALLFRLDSIRGFDSAVKDLRKTFIRSAIVLQEKVDSIAVGAENSIDQPMDDDSDAKLCEQLEPQDPVRSQLEWEDKLHCGNQESDSDSETRVTSQTLIGETEPPEEKGDEELEPVERELVVVKEEKSNTLEESTRNKETLERMVEESNRLVKLMADLMEKSEKQTRILSTLSERVGQLENAFACEKLWRRAKKLKKSRHSKSPDRIKDY